MIILIDRNLEGQALVLLGIITNKGLLELLSVSFVTLKEAGLPIDSNDRVIWQFIQSNQMILLTGNRSMKGKDSLERAMREENTPDSLPVVTIGNTDRLMGDPKYRDLCAERLIDIMLYIDNYKGVGRVFIP